MSHSGESGRIENLEFKWGKRKGVGGKNNEVQFYASFKYDGVDYSIYDCVYMHKEEETEPYIGKLIKIWETADKAKKVKIHWFFHSSEILNWLGDEEVHENEIFLASGEGAGVANVNPLEAIAGKCNVVCISKDSRNPQLSEQEHQMSDYVFYRTFDVGNCTISDKIDEKVAGLAVKFLFNTKEGETMSDVSKLDSDKKEEPVELKTARADGNLYGLVQSGSDNIKDSLVERKSLPDAKFAHGAALDSDEATTSGRQGSRAGDKAISYGMESDKNEKKKGNLPADHVKVEDAVKSQDSGALENKPSKRSTAVGSVKFSESRNIHRKISVDRNDGKGVKSARDTGTLDDRPSKKARVDSSVKLSESRNDIGVQKLSINSDRTKGKELAATLTSGGGPIAEVSSHCFDKDHPKQRTGEKTKLSNGKMLKVSASYSHGEDRKAEGDTFEVTRRSNDVRGNWFRELPWEERMLSAQEQGTLVQLSNIDPECTSKEVEDIIWHAFKENCTAKMVPRTAISSPHSGQAFIILKTRGAAERIIMELDDKCLMLSNRCPLIGSTVPPHSVQKKSAFVGHLSIDINKHQMQREWKEALSTSHYSQPNTIEYEMAMEWCLLHSRSKLWWRQFYQQQGDELRKLKANLKLK